jgi:Arc/MetJ-type ribon-helix-helix transcriptional regulator
MTLRLPEELQSFIHAKVQSGQFPSEEAAVAEAVRRFRLAEQAQARGAGPVANAEATSTPGSIGTLRDDAELLYRAEEHATTVDAGPVSIPPDDIAPADPLLGCMRSDAGLMDEIVADAYRQRREEPWRNVEL